MMRLTGPILAAALLAISWSGCTFGGLAGYAIDLCDPQRKTQEEDVCDRLNGADPTSCTPYQCEPVSRHCVRKARDDDRDGDPPPRCGGTDCDDADPARSGRSVEICDEKDNNCNGVIDEGVIGPGAERSAANVGALFGTDITIVPMDGVSAVATYVTIGQRYCLPVIELAAGSSRASVDCDLLRDQPLVPRQPVARLVSQGRGAVFVDDDSNQCPSGRLGYAFKGNDGTSSVPAFLACDPALPVALPTFRAMPGNAPSGVLAWYEAPLGARTDPVNGCASAAAARLRLLYMDGRKLVDVPPRLDASAALSSGELGVSMQPPAMLAPLEAGGIVMAAPLRDDVGVWLLTPPLAQALPPATHVPALAGAREVAIGARVDAPNKIALALVATVGCAPKSSVVMVMGTLDPTSSTFAFGPAIEVAPASMVATLPSIAWARGRGGQWWAGWIDSQHHAQVRRVADDGAPIGGPIDVGRTMDPAIVAATANGAATTFGYDPTFGEGAFVEVPLGCPSP